MNLKENNNYEQYHEELEHPHFSAPTQNFQVLPPHLYICIAQFKFSEGLQGGFPLLHVAQFD